MPRVFVGVGSNLNREENIRSGVKAMRKAFGALTVSPVYETRAVDFKGENFFNLVVAFDTVLEPAAVVRELRGIEQRFGRVPEAARFSPRTLDLDLLMYGDLCSASGDVKVPRTDMDKYAFVLWPLAEIAGALRHPVSGERIADIRSRLGHERDDLWPVEFDLEL